MAMLDKDQWHTLVTAATEDDGTVEAVWEELWLKRKYLDTADASGNLRFTAVVVDGLELMMAKAAPSVGTSDGGGQSGDWQQWFDHLNILHDKWTKKYELLLKAVSAAVGLSIDVMTTYSLTPPQAGQPDPGSPAYMGDPRYRSGWGGRVTW